MFMLFLYVGRMVSNESNNESNKTIAKTGLNINYKIDCLSKKFKRGLELHGLTPEKLITDKWYYCGSTRWSNIKQKKKKKEKYTIHKEGYYCNINEDDYFKQKYPNRERPEYNNKCICSNYIKINCYITNGDRIITLGSCCIRKFMPDLLKKTCKVCNAKHHNRTVDKCNVCRKGTCDKCNKKCPNSYRYCVSCREINKLLKKNKEDQDLNAHEILIAGNLPEWLEYWNNDNIDNHYGGFYTVEQFTNKYNEYSLNKKKKNILSNEEAEADEIDELEWPTDEPTRDTILELARYECMICGNCIDKTSVSKYCCIDCKIDLHDDYKHDARHSAAVALDNKCNICSRSCGDTYNTCYACNKGYTYGKCNQCNNKCNSNYYTCYSCFKNK